MLTNNNWIIFNGQTGEVFPVEKFPYEIGNGSGADLRLQDADLLSVHCSIVNGVTDGMTLRCAAGVPGIVVNAKAVQSEALASDKDYLIMLGKTTLAIRGGTGSEDWLSALNPDRWNVYNLATGQSSGPFSVPAIIEGARKKTHSLDSLVHLEGMETGLRVQQLLEGMKISIEQAPSPPPESSGGAVPEHREIAPDKGELICPVCWLQFDPEDIMHVATHPELLGDPVLGEDAFNRFHARRFDEHNRALDPKGSPCIEIACPHCRRELPFDFISCPSRIISIVGNGQSGKSYYLAVLTKLLPEFLFRHMNVVLQDANPTGNARLNALRNTLFGASEPKEAVLAKTELEDDMYTRCQRYDRTVFMPLPFMYNLSKDGCSDRPTIVFYDNAGEHFQPGIDNNLQPGAQHVSHAAGILFMFDPFHSPEFRELMKDQGDPQLDKPVIDDHDVILSEMKVRVQKLRNMSANESVATPLAVVLGKADGWLHALSAPLRTDLNIDGRLNQLAMDENSAMLRQFLMEKAPKVVANAESFSSNVKYFAVSSFGHVPVAVQTDAGFTQAPDPSKLNPLMTEAPVLWILSLTSPELLPTQT
jgi:hypothetical protein